MYIKLIAISKIYINIINKKATITELESLFLSNNKIKGINII